MPKEQDVNRQKQLRDVAGELFLQGGFDSTSMDSIAKSAGVSKRTPYIYYVSKHDLFSAVILVFLKELDQLLAPLWQQKGPPVEAIISCINTYAKYAIENPAKFQLIMTFEKRDFYPGRKRDLHSNADDCQRANDRLTNNLQALLERAISSGELKTGMTSAQYGLVLWSALAGIISIALERSDVLNSVYGWSEQAMVNAFVDQFISNKINKD